MCSLSVNGDFLLIRAVGTDADNTCIQQLCPGQNSIAILITPSLEAANDLDVAEIFDTIFIAAVISQPWQIHSTSTLHSTINLILKYHTLKA